MVKRNTCVFISGQGSNLKNLIQRSRDYRFPLNIKLIVSNNKNDYGIIHAKKNSIPYIIINQKFRNHDTLLLQILKKYRISFIINIHPSLLPKFKGLNTFSRILKNNEKKTGCTVHYVDEKLDGGNIIVKKSFFISSNDNEKTLKQKTQKLEYQIFPEAVIKIFRNN